MERSNPICCTRTPLLSPAVVAALCPFDDLRKFLPAGTVSFSVQQEMSTHRHESEHWHYLPSFHELSTIIQDELLLEVLTFLSNHNFIRITCRLGCGSWESRIVLRVYLIPYDLSNVQGKLRTRDETAILVPAREYLQVLLPRLVRSPSEWNLSKDPLSSSDNQHFFTPSTDDRTMAEIYSSLPSPTPDVTLPLFSNITHSDIDGLRSTLHPYQRRSVVAMLTKEIAPPPSNYDPLYVPLTGLDGTVFYFQPTTYELLSERPFVPPAKGGILCEELGTGKTVMILGLITSTIDQLSTPQESIQDDRPVLTPLSFTSFPWSPHITARQRLQKVVKLRQAKSLTTGIPPLKDILIHYLRSQPNGLQMRHYESELEDRLLHETYDKNVPFYLHYNEVLDPLRPRRQKVETKPRIMYLTTATLIIVPVNLLYQWEMEILKHCDDCVRCLVVRNTKPLIPASELATRYDIILMSHTRFSAEANKADIKMLHTWKSCKCSPASSSQPTFASCRCHHHLSVSPLFQVRWKRLVIDEGHVASSSTTNLVTLAKQLSIEFRWVVTGTPTTNLMGLQFGEASELQYPESDQELENLQLSCDESTAPSSEITSRPPARVWTTADRLDLNKLSHIMTDFLQIPQFALNRRLFTTHVVEPLMSRSGPKPGAIDVLTQVMKSVMIRHRISDVEQDILLPFIHHETILLDLDPYAVQTYNVMQASVAINAIDSERTDQDYLFHPRNAAHLQQTVENMSQALFWQVDDKLFGVKENLKDSEGFLQRVAARGHDHDTELLKDALNHMRLANDNPIWRELMLYPNVFQRVVDMPLRVYDAWTLLSPQICYISDPWSHHYYLLFHPEHLAQLHSTILNRPLLGIENLIELGNLVIAEELLRQQNFSSLVNDGKTSKSIALDKNVKFKELAMTSPEKLKQIRRELAEVHHQVNGPSQSNSSDGPSPLLRLSPLAKTRLWNSTSSKLDYIMNDILLYSPHEKFLIFSGSPLTLAYITEALNIIKVRHLHFTSKVDLKTREQYVTTFETSDTFRVFLMELKHGARGLNLVSASRVIFCEPVWKADVETQAIKRVHRIGQTRPVTVKTLAIRSTFEETMVSRSAALRNGSRSSGEKSTDFVDDRTMRDYLSNPTFLPRPPLPTIRLDIPFLGEAATGGNDQLPDRPTARKPAQYTERSATAGLSDGTQDVIEGGVDNPRKRRAESLDIASLGQDGPARQQRKKPRIGVRFDI